MSQLNDPRLFHPEHNQCNTNGPFKQQGSAVRVEWEDAYHHTFDGPVPLDGIKHNQCIVIDYGVVVFHDARGIMVAPKIMKFGDDPHETKGIMFIPNGMIRSVIELLSA